MKTKRNVQKTLKKSLVIIVGLVVISLTASAQEPWKSTPKSEILNEITVAISNRNNSSKQTTNKTEDDKAFPAYLTKEKEEELKLEDWVTEGIKFGMKQKKEINPENFSPTYLHQDAEEKKLKLEDWMVNNNYWK